jgi:hypothetical protein
VEQSIAASISRGKFFMSCDEFVSDESLLNLLLLARVVPLLCRDPVPLHSW